MPEQCPSLSIKQRWEHQLHQMWCIWDPWAGKIWTVLPCISDPRLWTLSDGTAMGQRICRVKARSGYTRKTEFVVLAVGGYFKVLKLSSERNHMSLGSLAEILSRKRKGEVWETCNLFTDTLVRMQQLYNVICSHAADGKKQLSQVVGAGGQKAKDQRKKYMLCWLSETTLFVFFVPRLKRLCGFFSSNLEIILIYFKPSIKTSHAALPGWW